MCCRSVSSGWPNLHALPLKHLDPNLHITISCKYEQFCLLQFPSLQYLHVTCLLLLCCWAMCESNSYLLFVLPNSQGFESSFPNKPNLYFYFCCNNALTRWTIENAWLYKHKFFNLFAWDTAVLVKYLCKIIISLKVGRLASFSLKLLYIRQIWTKLKNFGAYNQAFSFFQLVRAFFQ